MLYGRCLAGRRCCWGCRCGRSGRTRSSFRWRRRRSPRGATGGRCCASAPRRALPIAGLLGLNWHMFGSPFVTPYDRVLVVEKDRWVVEPSHRTFFTVPFWRGLWTQLTDPPHGPGGGRAAVRARAARLRPACTARAAGRRCWWAAACAAQLVMFAKYEQWNVVELRAALPAVGRGAERAARRRRRWRSSSNARAGARPMPRLSGARRSGSRRQPVVAAAARLRRHRGRSTCSSCRRAGSRTGRRT